LLLGRAKMTFKLGLKLWSTNHNYQELAGNLYRQGQCDYIELFAVPGSYDQYAASWRALKIPFVIHAPHFLSGLNFAKSECRKQNYELAGEAIKYADYLRADKIIFHPGIDGDIEETARQMSALKEARALVENKPYSAIGSDLICNGTTPEEISLVMKAAQVGFCLDIGHAICSAKAHNCDYLDYLKKFMALRPQMFHLTDGDVDEVHDDHKHIGQGNYNLQKIVAMLPLDAKITVETDKDSEDKLDDYVADITALRRLENSV
jgi:deoxyribonuclease IV